MSLVPSEVLSSPSEESEAESSNMPSHSVDSSEESDTEFLDLEARKRLQRADELTRDMGREEYIEYSECRQASFTYKKVKKFREWFSSAGLDLSKTSDDLIEILGYLGWELVGALTTTALMVTGPSQAPAGLAQCYERTSVFLQPPPKGLFHNQPKKVQVPINAEHIREAYQLLQTQNTQLNTRFFSRSKTGIAMKAFEGTSSRRHKNLLDIWR